MTPPRTGWKKRTCAFPLSTAARPRQRGAPSSRARRADSTPTRASSAIAGCRRLMLPAALGVSLDPVNLTIARELRGSLTTSRSPRLIFLTPSKLQGATASGAWSPWLAPAIAAPARAGSTATSRRVTKGEKRFERRADRQNGPISRACSGWVISIGGRSALCRLAIERDPVTTPIIRLNFRAGSQREKISGYWFRILALT